MSKVTSIREQKALTYAVLIALVGGALFLRPFFGLIVVAMIFAFLYSPLYNWFQKRFKNDNTAASVTLVVSILTLVIPLVIVIALTIGQATIIVSDVGESFGGSNPSQFLQNSLDSLNSFLSDVTGNDVLITEQDVWDKVSGYATVLAGFVLDLLQGWVGSIGSIVTNVILYVYVFMAVLLHQKKLIGLFHSLVPLNKDIRDLYLTRTGEMTKGMVRGQFVIALCQGVTSATTLYFAGVPYFIFWVVLLSFMSLIPLGGGIITIPLGIARVLLGDIWQGVFILLGHFLIVTNIDNVLRPALVPKTVRFNAALTLLAVFAGIGMFGFLGIVIGPIIMILILTTLETYQKTQQVTENIR